MNRGLTLNPFGLLAFVEHRLRLGAFAPQAFGRYARMLASVDRGALAQLARAPVRDARPRLRTASIGFGQAAAFASLHHRHLGPPAGHVFSVGVFHSQRLCGVAIVGRPVARLLDDGRTLEVTRVATDGTRNACSALLGAVRRHASARERSRDGQRERSREARQGRSVPVTRLVTYTLPCESGASLRAAGFRCDGPVGGGRWSRSSRPREDVQPQVRKLRWSLPLAKQPGARLPPEWSPRPPPLRSAS